MTRRYRWWENCSSKRCRHLLPERRAEMLGKLVKSLVVAVVAGMVVNSLPDIQRYLKIREM